MKKIALALILIIPLSIVIFYHTTKPLPEGLSYEGETYYVNDVQFLYDLTYESEDGITMYEQEIFAEIDKLINEAEDFIVIDMFLFNNYVEIDRGFPSLSSNLTESLINQKKVNPELQVIFITDPVNTSYHSHENKLLEKLNKNHIHVVTTSLDELRDSNVFYSGVWRIFFQAFGQTGIGWLPNPTSEIAPKVTLRSYLKLFNVKANHRKVIVSEKEAIISSANAHDESGFFANVAFKVGGEIINDIVEAEQAIIDYSTNLNHVEINKIQPTTNETGNIAVQYVTEGKIPKHVLQEINNTMRHDSIHINMFYLADREIIDSLVQAAKRDVTVKIILDANKIAFGHQKTGLPNLPTASELQAHENITIRWFDSDTEQYHPKMIFIKSDTTGTIISGSANYTTRNLDDLNLESDLKITSSLDEQVMKDVDSYFNRMWGNTDGIYTAEYEENEDELNFIRKLTYWIQKITKLTTY